LKSIRRYLVIILLAAITLINFLAAVQGYRAGMNQAELSFDQRLVNTANIIAGVDTFKSQELRALTPDAIAYQIWSSSQTLLQHTSNISMDPMAHFKSGFNYANFNNYRWRTFSLYDEFYERWIMVAHRMDSRYAMADSIIVESILPIAIGIPVAGIIIWLVVGSGLSPLYRLAKQLQQKQVEDLTPVNLTNPPQELNQVLQSTNKLLQRLSDLVIREKRFASDAAHELRTPISILKIHLHNLQHDHPEINKQTQEFQHGLERLEHLVDQILALYRCAPDQFIAKFETVDLYKIAQEVIAQHYHPIELRQQSIELFGQSMMIRAHAFAIDTLAQNLLSNASKYSPEGGEIRITVDQKGGHPFLCVEDSGPGIPEKERTQVFERFYRVKGNDETSSRISCGLGLAIVSNITQQHQAQIELGGSSFSTGLSVTVTFPGVDE